MCNIYWKSRVVFIETVLPTLGKAVGCTIGNAFSATERGSCMICFSQEIFRYRLMFWTDQGKQPKIESAWMNGEHRSVLVSENLGWPNGLSIDYLNDDRVYWSDSKEDVIEAIKYDGTDRRLIINEG